MLHFLKGEDLLLVFAIYSRELTAVQAVDLWSGRRDILRPPLGVWNVVIGQRVSVCLHFVANMLNRLIKEKICSLIDGNKF